MDYLLGHEIMNVDDGDEDPIVIELYAQQFNWKARYTVGR